MLSGTMEARLYAAAIIGGAIFFALAAFILFPAGLIALITRGEREARERLRREGVRCQVFVKSYRRVSMTQHRVLFDLHLPEGRMGREYMLAGLSDVDLANWAALEVPLTARASAGAETIALDAAPPPAPGRPFFPMLVAATAAIALVGALGGALFYSDDQGALQPELRALCGTLERQQIDVAGARILIHRSAALSQRVSIELDGDPYEMRLYSAVPATKPTGDCLRSRAVELCTSLSGRSNYNNVAMSRRVKAAFAVYAR
jgi:hypothetical protein